MGKYEDCLVWTELAWVVEGEQLKGEGGYCTVAGSFSSPHPSFRLQIGLKKFHQDLP